MIFSFSKNARETSQKNSRLVSFDVMSLYTNILHELGLKAIEYWLDKYSKLIHSTFNKAFILESSKLILEKNDFVFNE